MEKYFSSYEKGSAENTRQLEKGVELEHLRLSDKLPEAQEIIEIYGDPEADAEVWRESRAISESGIECVRYASEQLLGERFSEDSFTRASEQYLQSSGASVKDICALLKREGLEVGCEREVSLSDLCEMLDSGEKVLCPVSSLYLSCPELCSMPGVSADLVVEVIGIDNTGEEPRIIFNDPTASSGGTSCPGSVFFNAWRAADNCAVSAGLGG